MKKANRPGGDINLELSTNYFLKFSTSIDPWALNAGREPVLRVYVVSTSETVKQIKSIIQKMNRYGPDNISNKDTKRLNYRQRMFNMKF